MIVGLKVIDSELLSVIKSSLIKLTNNSISATKVQAMKGLGDRVKGEIMIQQMFKTHNLAPIYALLPLYTFTIYKVPAYLP